MSMSPTQKEGGSGVLIIVLLRPEPGHRMKQLAPPSAGVEELARVTKEFGVVLRPMHPGTTDPDLARFFSVETPDQVTANRLLASLRDITGVEAAYVKPPDALP